MPLAQSSRVIEGVVVRKEAGGGGDSGDFGGSAEDVAIAAGLLPLAKGMLAGVTDSGQQWLVHLWQARIAVKEGLPGVANEEFTAWLTGQKSMPFGPALALGTIITWLCWQWIGPPLQLAFFDAALMTVGPALAIFLLLVISFMLRLVRGSGVPT